MTSYILWTEYSEGTIVSLYDNRQQNDRLQTLFYQFFYYRNEARIWHDETKLRLKYRTALIILIAKLYLNKLIKMCNFYSRGDYSVLVNFTMINCFE